eukprot:6213298-Pleurochrysis_carterae.AAC.5
MAGFAVGRALRRQRLRATCACACSTLTSASNVRRAAADAGARDHVKADLDVTTGRAAAQAPIRNGRRGAGEESARTRWATSMAASYACVSPKSEGCRQAGRRSAGRECDAPRMRAEVARLGRTAHGTKNTGTAPAGSWRYPASAGGADPHRRGEIAEAARAAGKPGERSPPKAGALSGARTWSPRLSERTRKRRRRRWPPLSGVTHPPPWSGQRRTSVGGTDGPMPRRASGRATAESPSGAAYAARRRNRRWRKSPRRVAPWGRPTKEGPAAYCAATSTTAWSEDLRAPTRWCGNSAPPRCIRPRRAAAQRWRARPGVGTR